MDPYRLLHDSLKAIMGDGQKITIWQGIVNSVNGTMCEVQVGSMAVPDVRLKASETDSDNAMMIVPKVGTAVTIGSLSGDLTQLVVLKVDEVDHIVVNGGKLGGLINIEAFTSALNNLVQTFNSHTHTVPNGTSAIPTQQAPTFSKSDYEDETFKH